MPHHQEIWMANLCMWLQMKNWKQLTKQNWKQFSANSKSKGSLT
jgi:hypothetical protein